MTAIIPTLARLWLWLLIWVIVTLHVQQKKEWMRVSQVMRLARAKASPLPSCWLTIVLIS